MPARLSLPLLILMLAACATVAPPVPRQIALLASFEGRYSEIGYNALYAARLALVDAGRSDLQLLPIDDGGTEESAVARARALARNEQIAGVIAVGYFAADTGTQAAYGDLPVLIVGSWTTASSAQNIMILSNPTIAEALTVSPEIALEEAAQTRAPVMGGEVFALSQLPLLHSNPAGVTVLSSALLPTEAFYERYRAIDQFAKPPGLLAMLTYDAVRILADAVANDRPATISALRATAYTGLNGAIRFENGFWADAPVHTYTYSADGTLITLDNPVE